MDVNGDRNGDFSLMAMTDVKAGTYEVRRSEALVVIVFDICFPFFDDDDNIMY